MAALEADAGVVGTFGTPTSTSVNKRVFVHRAAKKSLLNFFEIYLSDMYGCLPFLAGTVDEGVVEGDGPIVGRRRLGGAGQQRIDGVAERLSPAFTPSYCLWFFYWSNLLRSLQSKYVA